MTNRFQIAFFLFIAFLFAGLSALHSQVLIIESGTIEHNKDFRPCIRVRMEPAPKEVKKAWDDYLKDNFDVNLKGIGFLTNKDILSAKAIEFPELYDKELSLYTRVIEQGDFTEMCVFAALGYDIYLNEDQYPVAYKRLQGIVDSFLESYLPAHYKELVENTEEELEDLLDRRKDLSEDISDNEDEIAKLEQANREMTKELIDVEAKIKDFREQLDIRKEKAIQLDRVLTRKSN